MAQANTHESFHREEHIQGSSNKGFGQVFAGFFAILAGLSYWHGSTTWHYTLPVAVAFLVIAYTVPAILGPLNRLWMKFGLVLYKVMNPIVLGLLFFEIGRAHV